MSDQAAEQSLEDRIGSMFDPGGPDDEPEQVEEASEEAEPEAVEGDEAEQPESTSEEYEEVEYEGQTYQVPKELKEGLLRHADYTQKTQQLAEQRRTVELQQKEIVLAQQEMAFQQSVAEDVDNLKLLDAYIKHVETTSKWSEMTTDQIVRARLELDQLRGQKQELERSLQGKWQEFQSKTDAERQKVRKEMVEHLSKTIPSWSDDTKSAIEKYAQSNGYPEIAVQNMSAMDYQIAWKAMQFDRLQAEKGSAVAKASKAPPVVKPGPVKHMPKDVQDRLNFRKAMKKASNSSDKARLIERRMAEKFGA